MKRKKTFSAKSKQIERKWFIIDAKGKVLGRLAEKVAGILRGKNKPTFTPNVDVGDHCIVINAKDVEISGNKREDKKYFTHSGYPGGHKLVSFDEMINKHPEKVIIHAVSGMIPRTRLGRQIIKKLKVYKDEKHLHIAQNPVEIKE